MISSPGNFESLSDRPSAKIVAKSRSPLPRSVTTGVALLLLALAIATGVDVARDYHSQSDALQAQAEKRQFALLGELELGHAVQDFKDCLLRNDTSYCDDFDRHIQAVDRTVSLYGAQGAPQADEERVLGALRPALAAYRSALNDVRNMQGRHATIQEIDGAVRGEDRPIAAGLSELAVLSLNRSSRWHVPLHQAFWLIVFTSLAGFSLFLTIQSSVRGWRETAQSVRQLSNRMLEWEEEKESNAFVRLHDGVCQSLVAIMYLLRSTQRVAAGAQYPMSERIPEQIIPSLQAVIQDARDVALQLRPPRMLEAGLLATLNSLWVDSRALNPALAIKPRVLAKESDIPEALKPVILRIAQMTLGFAEQNLSACRLAWVLERVGETLCLSIEMTLDAEMSRERRRSSATVLNLLEAIRARVVLSGGSSESASNAGPRTIVCTWQV